MENIVVTRKKKCLLSKCLLVLDKVNEVSARDGKLFLQEAGMRKRVKGVATRSYISGSVPCSSNLPDVVNVQLVRLFLSALPHMSDLEGNPSDHLVHPFLLY